jgi:hypothetical protein
MEKLWLLAKSKSAPVMGAVKKYLPVFVAALFLMGVAFGAAGGGVHTQAVGKGAMALFSQAPSIPPLNLNMEYALTVIFDYAVMVFGSLIGVAAIGIGFKFGLGLIQWVAKMLGSVLSF